MKRSEAIQEAKKSGQTVEYARERDFSYTNNPNKVIWFNARYEIKFAQVAELRNKFGELEMDVVSDGAFDSYEEAIENLLNYYNTLQEAQEESGTMIALVDVITREYEDEEVDIEIWDIVKIL